MKCPVYRSPMMHLGYFLWECTACGHRCTGDLPTPPS
jgi:hypothetical protein